MKTDIGSVDAIDIEAVSAAYVENFALKVFQSADNEDRRGAATKWVYNGSICLCSDEGVQVNCKKVSRRFQLPGSIEDLPKG